MSEENTDEMLDKENKPVEKDEQKPADKQDDKKPKDGENDDETKQRNSYKEKAAALESELEEIRKALHERNKENQKRREQNKVWEELGVDPDTVREWKEAQEKAELQQAEAKGEWEKIKQKMIEDFDKKEESYNSQLARMKATLESTMLDSTIENVFLSNDGVPNLLREPMTELRSRMRLIEKDDKFIPVVVDEDGTPMVNSHGDYMKPADYISQEIPKLKEHSVYGMAFKAPATKGNGTSVATDTNSKQTKKTEVAKKPRSQMSSNEKEAFISEHGIAEYNKLPLK